MPPRFALIGAISSYLIAFRLICFICWFTFLFYDAERPSLNMLKTAFGMGATDENAA